MTASDLQASPQDLISLYISKIDSISRETRPSRIRAAKGKLVEEMSLHIVRLAWRECGGEPGRLSFGDVKTYRVPVQSVYVDQLPEDVRAQVNARKNQYFYRAKVDRHVFVDGVFVIGVECKSYTENAMLKRILVDFRLLKSLHPALVCCLFQIESMLGGDYSDPLAMPQIGSSGSHTLMSYFPEVELNIITLLEGERNIKQPIHQSDYFKELTSESLDLAIERFSDFLMPFV